MHWHPIHSAGKGQGIYCLGLQCLLAMEPHLTRHGIYAVHYVVRALPEPWCLVVLHLHPGQPLPYCQLPLWHAPYTGSDDDLARLPHGVAIEHVTAAGHAYVCKHNSSTYGWYHTILVIDRSGSMSSRRIKPVSPEVQSAIRHHRWPLDNVAGVVCEAALAYMRIRQSKNPRDLVSCVTFNTTAKQVFQRQALSSPARCSDLLRMIMQEVSFTCPYLQHK